MRAPTPPHHPMRRPLAVMLTLAASSALLAAVGAGVSAASSSVTHRTVRTYTVGGHSTKTTRLTYPNALQYAGESHHCAVRLLEPGAGQMRILVTTSALGGSECLVKVKNTGSIPHRFVVTATTTYPVQG